VVEGSSGKNRAASTPPFDSNSLFAPISIGLKIVVKIEHGSQSKILIEDMPDLLCFRFVDMKLPVLMVIAEGNDTAHPHTLFLGGSYLIPNPLPGDLSLELSNESKILR
jgi:hypothetical protein